MSITATADGTAYNGIDTITVGGKTISLTESGGGGGSFASGSFTPSENTYTQVINTGLSSVSGFALYLTDSTAQSVRTASAIIYDTVGGHAVIAGSNTSGTTVYSAADFRNIPDSGAKVSVAISGGTITITTSNNSSTGYFVTAEYKWFAW